MPPSAARRIKTDDARDREVATTTRLRRTYNKEGAIGVRLKLESCSLEHPGQGLLTGKLSGHGLRNFAGREFARRHHDRASLSAKRHQRFRERLRLDVKGLGCIVSVDRGNDGDHH